MTEDYFFEAIDVLKHLQQQSKSNMKGLEIRQVDVDKINEQYWELIEQSEKMRLVADEMEKSSADKRVKFDQKLYEMALKLGLPTNEVCETDELVKNNPSEAVTKVVPKIVITKAEFTKNCELEKRLERVRTISNKEQNNHTKRSTIPHLQDASVKDLLSVRARGKMSLQELNGVVAEINTVLKEKYELLRRTKNNLCKTDQRRIDAWDLQVEQNPDLKHGFFITESELIGHLPPKLKAQFRIARTCLSALGRIEVIQRSNMTFFIVLTE
ncbi:unnamed protein product [Enterobius vermicularis]|uniref:SKA complex subunit 1 n=1 Tax=Enterobius vermicularis TaxID=51028 RepID=A0A0N4V456_ENTVE|nr:unnamed protein product [Enterobius vermicularis]